VTGLRQLRSFSTEMMKLAAGVPDAGIRELLAFRRGEEYLPGGRLESNTVEESPNHEKFGSGMFDPKMGLASGDFDHHARKKKDNAYQKGRDYAASGMKGGLTGLGVAGAVNAMRKKPFLPTAMKARRAAGLGASVALLDRAYRHDDLPKTAGVVRSTASGLRSPAAQLSQASATGGFKSVVRSTEGRAPLSLQSGQKFRIS